MASPLVNDDIPAGMEPATTGEMAGLIAAKDWSATPLGPADGWSDSLRLALGMMLASGFPMALRWGPDFVLIYNDGYTSILGDKHPWALGLPAREAWSEVWPQIEPFHHAILSGRRKAMFAEDVLLRINRHGDAWEDGRFTLSYSPTPDASAPTGIGGIFVTALETTLRVAAEREREAELAAAQEALRQSQKMEAVGQLTGGIAHDFNNLLTGISGSLEMMKTRIAQGRLDAVERYITSAEGATRRAAALTHRLLAFSRRQTLDPKPTNANRLVAGMEDLIRGTVGPSVAVEVVGAAGLWSILVDPNQLENALLNLAINARDAMPEGGRITIETANVWLDDRAGIERDLPPGQYISVCVSDTGSGMTPEVIERAFDPFFTTKPLGLGTGLGLSMIYGFARQSDGQVRIYSELAKGTTMCLYFPRHLGDHQEEAPRAAIAQAPSEGQSGKVVLVVDDEPTVRMLVAEVLESSGFTVLEAADGAAGLAILRSQPRLDLLITDVGLPGGLNGRQVADMARVARPELKVLFITGYAANAAVGAGRLDPGMQVLTKPFAMDALADKIREMAKS